MTDLITLLKQTTRPRLLIRAARFGAEDYSRDRDLKRLLDQGARLSPARALRALVQLEAVIEDARNLGDASYRAARHVEVLIAIMAEARMLSQASLGRQ